MELNLHQMGLTSQVSAPEKLASSGDPLPTKRQLRNRPDNPQDFLVYAQTNLITSCLPRAGQPLTTFSSCRLQDDDK